VLSQHAWILMHQGQPGAALPLVESRLDLARRLGEPYLTAGLLSVRGAVANAEGDARGAARHTAEAVRLYRQAGDRLRTGHVLGNLGYSGLAAGELDAARRHLAESLDIARTYNDRAAIVYQAFNLGLAEYLRGELDAAGTLFTESLDLARRAGMRSNAAEALLGLALADRGGADPAWPARLHAAADHTLAEVGHTLAPLEVRLAARDRERLRAAMGDEEFEAEYAEGRVLDPEQVLAGLRRTDTVAAPTQVQPQAQAAGSGQDATVLTPRELDVLRLVAQGLSNPRHRPAARPQRAHRPPPPGQHPPQARPLDPRRRRGLGSPCRTTVCPARTGAVGPASPLGALV
jgi:ATP/maltotriose-dependent transcriptional regulator MalT